VIVEDRQRQLQSLYPAYTHSDNNDSGNLPSTHHMPHTTQELSLWDCVPVLMKNEFFSREENGDQ
jgi:hypothetical protein